MTAAEFVQATLAARDLSPLFIVLDYAGVFVFAMLTLWVHSSYSKPHTTAGRCIEPGLLVCPVTTPAAGSVSLMYAGLTVCLLSLAWCDTRAVSSITVTKYFFMCGTFSATNLLNVAVSCKYRHSRCPVRNRLL